MTAALVGTLGTVSRTNSGVATYGQTPTAGNKLLMTISGTRTNATPSVITLSSTGSTTWTIVDNGGAVHSQVNGASSQVFARYWADAVGSDTAPTITGTSTLANTTLRIWVEEISGLVAGAPEIVGTIQSTTGASGTLTVPTYTTTTANDWLWTSFAYYTTASPTFTPSAPLSGHVLNAKAGATGASFIESYANVQASAGATGALAVAFSAGGGTPSAHLASAAFKITPVSTNDNPGWGPMRL